MKITFVSVAVVGFPCIVLETLSFLVAVTGVTCFVLERSSFSVVSNVVTFVVFKILSFSVGIGSVVCIVLGKLPFPLDAVDGVVFVVYISLVDFCSSTVVVKMVVAVVVDAVVVSTFSLPEKRFKKFKFY